MHPLELIPGVTFIRPTQRGLHERGGKFQSVMDQGINFFIPVYDQVTKVNTTEQMADVDTTEMITKDNLNVTVDAQVYYRVRSNSSDVKKSVYEVDDYDYQIVNLAQTTARAVIGDMKFEKVNNDRNTLNTKLREELEKQTNGWGLEVVRVELQEITPPSSVQKSMNEIVTAENEKDAAEDFANARETKADGKRRAAIKKAKGEKKAEILEAEGKAQAITKKAKAESKKIELVNKSIRKHFKNGAETYKQLETVQNSLQNGSKYILGTDQDITTVLSETGDVTPIKDQDTDKDDDLQLDNEIDIEKDMEEIEEEIEKSEEEKEESHSP